MKSLAYMFILLVLALFGLPVLAQPNYGTMTYTTLKVANEVRNDTREYTGCVPHDIDFFYRPFSTETQNSIAVYCATETVTPGWEFITTTAGLYVGVIQVNGTYVDGYPTYQCRTAVDHTILVQPVGTRAYNTRTIIVRCWAYPT